jgi:hypothetical protein
MNINNLIKSTKASLQAIYLLNKLYELLANNILIYSQSSLNVIYIFNLKNVIYM